jgi:hypothetical protein
MGEGGFLGEYDGRGMSVVLKSCGFFGGNKEFAREG